MSKTIFENSKTNVPCHIDMRTCKAPNLLISRKLVGQREWEDVFKDLEKDSANYLERHAFKT